MKPRITKGMDTFMGCAVGELRLSTLRSCYPGSIYEKLEKRGLIMIVQDNKDPKHYIGLAVTAAGKDHIRPLENFYARI